MMPAATRVFVLMLAVCSVEGIAAEPDRCLAGTALLEAGLLDEATTVFVEILGDADLTAEDRQCAVEALPRVRNARIEAQLAQAALFQRRGDFDSAAAAIREALNSDPQSAAARLALDSLPPRPDPEPEPKDDPVARASALAEFGFYQEARDVLAESLKSSSDPPVAAIEIPPDLQYLSGGKPQWWRDFRRDLEPWTSPILEIIAAFIAVLIVVHLLRRTFVAKPVLRIEEFRKGGFEEEHFGAYFSHNLLSRLESLTSGAETDHIDLVTGPIDPIAVPAEIEAVIPAGSATWMSPAAWVQAIPALIGWLFPGKTITVTGELHSSGNRGVGVTVRLVEKKKILVGYAFWEDDFDDSHQANQHDDEENLYQLAEYVAVWILFDTMKRFTGERLNLLGTKDWRSYAYFRAGFFAENDERNVASQNLYIRALQKDPGLRGARVNLGLLFIRDGKHDAALEQLSQVREEAEHLDESDRDPTLYSAIYNLAALKGDLGDTAGAIRDVRDLLQMLGATYDKIEKKTDGYQDPHLKEHLDLIKPAAMTMLGGLLVAQGDEAGIAIVEGETSRQSLSVRHQYNLACSYSILADFEKKRSPPDVDKADHYLDLSLNHLKRAFQLSSRATRQAVNDPSLCEVRTCREVSFNSLVADFDYSDESEEVAEPDSPLSELEIIGDVFAEKLADTGIRTTDELLARAMTATDRTGLAGELTISPRVVTQWAHAVDMTRIVGVGLGAVNLLLKAQVASISDLAGKTPHLLADDLRTIAAALGDDDGPDVGTVRKWIEHANTNTRPVVC